jgi:hypothetical protein
MSATRLISALAISILLCTGSAFGAWGSWTYYDFGDFDANVFDEHNNTSDQWYPNGVGWLPSPGPFNEGGEHFDIEGLNFALEGGSMYVTLTKSFGQFAYSSSWGSFYSAGDLFFELQGAGGDALYALDLSNFAGGVDLWEVSTFDYIPNVNGSYYNNSSVRFGVGPYQVSSGVRHAGVVNSNELYNATYEVDNGPQLPDYMPTYVWEFEFAVSELGVDLSNYSGIEFSTTLECGNDKLLKRYDLDVVPEPGTVILLGVGLLGLGAGLRRRKQQ